MVEASDLQTLLQLQDVETTIRRLERRLDELPEQAALDAAIREAAAAKAEYDARRVDLDLLDSEIRKAENEAGLLGQRRDADQARMYGGEITNPRELQAVRAEIENVSGRIDAFEERALELMEQREELEATIASIEERRQHLADEQERLAEARDTSAKEILSELAEARVRRDREREQIPDDVLRRYEQKKERHGGIGVGLLDRNVCTACHLELTPLEISDARDEAPLTTCPQCQRLLVVVD